MRLAIEKNESLYGIHVKPEFGFFTDFKAVKKAVKAFSIRIVPTSGKGKNNNNKKLN